MTSEIGKIGWRFPPTNGGRVDGFNDPGIAHFSGSPLSSLARETIQNSLDARGTLGTPVHVSFELIDLTPEHIGRDELADAIDACRLEAQGDPMAEPALDSARELIRENTITCLRVSDRNTTGLRGEQWRALVKMQGVSLKPGVAGAGGSHGIGKYAPFAVSNLRTVFYWTCYQEDGKDVEYFQGRSVLMSHKNRDGETQGTGFYGIKENCRELVGRKIPERFREVTSQGRPVHGTCLTIAGFRASDDWRWNIASSVVENFFYAIHIGALSVIVEPDPDSKLLEIEQTSLGAWFTKLLEEGVNLESTEDENDNALRQAQKFWQIISEVDPTVERQDTDLGHCRLWVRVEKDLPSKVALVRRPGMLVTTEQSGLIRFPGFRDFAAVCVFEDPMGNELLRRMENAQHNKFEPDRLPVADRERGRKALNRITRWIRSEIRKSAGPPEGVTSTVLTELAVYLPDPHPDEPFDDVSQDSDGIDGIREPGFGYRVKVTLKPVRRPSPSVLPAEYDEEEAGDADGDAIGSVGGSATGTNGGEGGSGGPGEGEGTGGTGIRGGGRSKLRRIPISNVRMLAIEGRENSYRVSFRADGSGVSRIDLEEAGDSSAMRRDDIRAVDENVNLDHFRLVEGERAELEITADSPIGGRSWRLTAVDSEGEEQ